MHSWLRSGTSDILRRENAFYMLVNCVASRFRWLQWPRATYTIILVAVLTSRTVADKRCFSFSGYPPHGFVAQQTPEQNGAWNIINVTIVWWTANNLSKAVGASTLKRRNPSDGRMWNCYMKLPSRIMNFQIIVVRTISTELRPRSLPQTYGTLQHHP